MAAGDSAFVRWASNRIAPRDGHVSALQALITFFYTARSAIPWQDTKITVLTVASAAPCGLILERFDIKIFD